MDHNQHKTSIKVLLASNISLLRSKKGLSQGEIARRAGIPRTTWTNLESGQANPSLTTLVKVAEVLQISLEELISKPIDGPFHLIKADQMNVQKRDGGEVRVYKLLPEHVKGLVMDRFEMNAGALLRGVPHIRGSSEYLVCIDGEVSVFVAGSEFNLSRGDVLVFPGDQVHSYQNRGRKRNSCVSVVAITKD